MVKKKIYNENIHSCYNNIKETDHEINCKYIYIVDRVGLFENSFSEDDKFDEFEESYALANLSVRETQVCENCIKYINFYIDNNNRLIYNKKNKDGKCFIEYMTQFIHKGDEINE